MLRMNPDRNGCRESRTSGRIQARTDVQQLVAAFCRQLAVAAAFAYCGWFALCKAGALILTAMVFMPLAWRPIDRDAHTSRRIRNSQDNEYCR